MKHVLTYENFSNNVHEAEGKDAKSEAPAAAKEEPVDTSKGTMQEMEIDGKKFVAVLTTYKAIAAKQAAMGTDAVGMITLPGGEQVWELYSKSKAKL